jgi:hypothetical protein
MSNMPNAAEAAVRPKGKPWPPAEFADFIGCTPKHVRYLMDSQKLGFIRVGKRKRLIPDAEARRFAAEGV